MLKDLQAFAHILTRTYTLKRNTLKAGLHDRRWTPRRDQDRRRWCSLLDCPSAERSIRLGLASLFALNRSYMIDSRASYSFSPSLAVLLSNAHTSESRHTHTLTPIIAAYSLCTVPAPPPLSSPSGNWCACLCVCVCIGVRQLTSRDARTHTHTVRPCEVYKVAYVTAACWCSRALALLYGGALSQSSRVWLVSRWWWGGKWVVKNVFGAEYVRIVYSLEHN